MTFAVNAWHRWREPLAEVGRHVVLPYALHRALLTAAALFATQLIPQHRGFHIEPYVAFLDVWFRWDSVYYLMIANDGYAPSAFADPSSFFPGFPALIAVLGTVLPLPIAAMVASHGAALAALSVLYRWVEDLEDTAMARRATLLALVFPTSYFFTAVYPVGTYVALAAGALLAVRKGRVAVAGLLVMGACLTRPQGFVCLTFPFVLGWLLRSRRWRELPLWVTGSVPALGVLMAIHWLQQDDPLGFLHSRGIEFMPAFWAEQERPPVWAVLWDEGLGGSLMKRLLNWSALALVAASAVHLLRRKEVELALLTLLTVALPLYFYGQLFDIASMGRYALGAFPIFLVLARWTAHRGRDAVHWGFTMLQTLLFALFASWYWVE